ncbi:phage gp46-like protein [Sphingomonas vulcanisoli]|uniref:Phage gp46-like protein n=1 Tax=Sphingomonas vulcanisoli TaxID=1658060 RepID=A0ABX0TNZ1_9SPHN|nr:phage GP46 family protein [Sphingomonas vulcanisoli]NIJ07246.1 phage gp46-like protein [Sphingomonas vulcanisoli]
MADISTIWSPSQGIGDWYLTNVVADIIIDETGSSVLDELGNAINDGLLAGGGDLVVGNDLGTAILISLFTDAAASADDAIPDTSGDPRGWWGDLSEDRPIGSKIWLRMRSKQTDLVLAQVKNDIETALQWLLDDGIAAAVDVMTQWMKAQTLGARVVVTRANGTTASLNFSWAWKEIV